MTARLARWWEDPATADRPGKQGRIVSPQGRSGTILCPECGEAPVVYNGNYFCDNWVFPGPPEEGECRWALPHPATTKRDREICDLIGVDYE